MNDKKKVFYLFEMKKKYAIAQINKVLQIMN